MKRVTLIIIGMLMCVSAFAGEFTILGGASRFTKQNDGVWYQEAFPYKLNMSSPSLGLRYDWKPNDNGRGWTAGYMHLGRVTSHAKAVALDGRLPGDGGYNSATMACNGECWPLSQWDGVGMVHGVYVGATKRIASAWTIEGGIYLYRPTWDMDVPDWIPTRDATPRHIHVTHHAFWQPGPYVGVRYKPEGQPLSLNVSIWQTATRGDEWCSLYHNATYNLSVGYSW